MKYKKVLYTSHHIQRHCGNVFDYFINASEYFYYFSHAPGFQPSPCTFEVYHNGVRKSLRKFFLYKGSNVKMQYLVYYCYYLYIVLFLIPSKTVIINVNPVFCWLHSLIKLIKKHTTIFWIYDYFPTDKFSIYNWFDAYYNRTLNNVLYLGPALQDYYGPKSRKGSKYYRDMLIFGQKNIKNERVPQRGLIGFVGNLKDYQGIELIIEAVSKNQDLRLDIIGDGAGKNNFQDLATKAGINERIKFYGFVPEEDVEKITSRWLAGLAPYEPVKENFTNFAHPGKVVFYLQYGLPVIMTKVSHMQDKVNKYKLGELVNYDSQDLLRAILRVQENYDQYEAGVKKFNQEFEFNHYYNNKFAFIHKL